MGKQVTYNESNKTLYVKTRIAKEHKDITRIVVSCKDELRRFFYLYPEAAYNDPDYLNSISLMGYRVSDLIIVAERLKAGGVDILQFKNYNDGFKDGYARAQADINEALQASIEKIINGG